MEQIAREAGIPIESLPDELLPRVFPRGRPIFGYVGGVIDDIVCEYANMQWWVSDVGLNLAVVVPDTPPHVPSFDELIAAATIGSYPKSQRGGRPKSLLKIKGELVSRIRGGEKQEAFALACRIGRGKSISVDTLQTAETNNLATLRTLQQICAHPKTKQLKLRPEQLIKIEPEKPEK